MKNKPASFIKNNLSFILFIVLLFSFRSSVADWYHVPSGSMEPNIQVGDRIVVDKAAYTLELPFTDIVVADTGAIARGDIVIIQSQAANTRLVKRVVGIAGDRVSLNHNTLMVNGKAATRSRADNMVYNETLDDSTRQIQLLPIDGAYHSFNTVTVPPNHVLVMGDNRNNSVDSRYYGFIPEHEIQGQATGIAFSVDKDNFYLPRPSRFFAGLQ